MSNWQYHQYGTVLLLIVSILTLWSLGKVTAILKIQFPNALSVIWRFFKENALIHVPLDLIDNELIWFRWWLEAVRQHAITWSNVDENHQNILSLGTSTLNEYLQQHHSHSTSPTRVQIDWLGLTLLSINTKFHVHTPLNKVISLKKLTHCGPVMSYGITKLGQHGSDNGWVPSGNKPLPEPLV